MAAAVSAMAAMHKDMHQRAGQQKQERQGTDKVCTVFAQQKVRRNRSEDKQADGISGAPEERCAHLAWWLIVMVFVVHL